MIAELKAALERCGVPGTRDERRFFNHNAQADPEAVRAIAARFPSL